MNLSEIITEYLNLKGASVRAKLSDSAKGDLVDADKWLEDVAKREAWPKGIVEKVQACWIDYHKLAINEAKYLLDLYEVDHSEFNLTIEEDTIGDHRKDHWISVLAIHKGEDYPWIRYRINVYLLASGEPGSEVERVRILDPETYE